MQPGPNYARYLRIVVLSLGAAWLSFVVLMNAFMGLGGLEAVINGNQDEIVVRFEHGRSFWPGRAHFEGLTLVGHHDSVEWEARVDETDVNVFITHLIDNEFHVKTATVTGTTFRVRRARPLAALCAQPWLPDIGGLASASADDCTAQRETKKPDTPSTPPAEDDWRVHLEGMVVRDVRQVWVGGARLDGHVEVRGGWYFWPGSTTRLENIAMQVRTSTGTFERIARVRALSLDGTVTSTSLDLDGSIATNLDRCDIDAKGSGLVDVDLTGGTLVVREAMLEFDADFGMHRDDDVRLSLDAPSIGGKVTDLTFDSSVAAQVRFSGGPRRWSLDDTRLEVQKARLNTPKDTLKASWRAAFQATRATAPSDDSWLSAVWRVRDVDADPIAYLATKQSSLPGWIVDALIGGRATGHVQTDLTPDAWVIPNGEIAFGSVDVHMVARVKDGLWASFLFQSVALAAALHLAPGQRADVDVLDATNEFQERAAKLRAIR